MRKTLIFSACLFAASAVAEQPTPEQTIAVQQSMLQRANACVDAYTNWFAAEQRTAQAQAQAAALTKELAELRAKQQPAQTKP